MLAGEFDFETLLVGGNNMALSIYDLSNVCLCGYYVSDDGNIQENLFSSSRHLLYVLRYIVMLIVVLYFICNHH